MHMLSSNRFAGRTSRLGRLLCLLLIASFGAAAYAVEPGDLDTAFSGDGVVLTNVVNSADNVAEAVVVQLDGKIVVAGWSSLGANREIALVRYDFDGSLDPGFDFDGIVTTPIPGGGVDDAAFAVTIQSDQKILVGGQSWNGSDFDFALARYETDGSLDTSFGTDGIVTTDFAGFDDGAFAIALQSDGKILLAGFTTTPNGGEDFAVARYEADGSLDLRFGTSGTGWEITDIAGFDDGARAMTVQADGRILLAGSAFNNNNDEDVAVVRYLPGGSLDTGFGTNGRRIIDFGSSDEGATGIALQANGRIMLSGSTLVGGVRDFLALRLLTSGELDSTFGAAGGVVTDLGGLDDLARGVALQLDGKILLAGSSNRSARDEFALARYESDGTLDTTFGTGGIVLTPVGTLADAANAISLQPDGRILLAGGAATATGSDFAVARYRQVSGPDAVVADGSGGGCTLSTRAPLRDLSLLLLVGLLFVLRVARGQSS